MPTGKRQGQAQGPVHGPTRPRMLWPEQQAAERKAVAKNHRKEMKAREKRRGAERPQFEELRTTASQVQERGRMYLEVLGRLQPIRAEIEAQLGDSKVGLGGSGSTYAQLHKMLLRYEKAVYKGDLDGQEALLATLQDLTAGWLNDPGHREPEHAARRRVVDRLSDTVALDRLALSRHRAQEVYLAGLVSGARGTVPRVTVGADGNPTTKELRPIDDDYEHRFKAATSSGRSAGAQATGGSASWWDSDQTPFWDANDTVTPAERAAIRAYTAGDYRYMNAAAANSPGWMADIQKEKDHHGQPMEKNMHGLDIQTLMQEGSLHSAMAQSGLRKLPQFEGTSYRGETRTREQLAAMGVVAGGSYTFVNLSSTSTSVQAAQAFGVTHSKPTKVTVLWELHDCGKDIAGASYVVGEAEVLVLAGESVDILSVEEVQAGETDDRPVMGAAQTILASQGDESQCDGVWIVTVRSKAKNIGEKA